MSSQLIFLRRIKCTEMPLKPPKKPITPKSLKNYWSSSLKIRKDSSLLQLCIPAMTTSDLTSSFNMLGGSTCMSSVCHTWYSLSLNSKPESKQCRRRTKIERRRMNNRKNRKWTDPWTLLPMILTWWCREASQCWQVEATCTQHSQEWTHHPNLASTVNQALETLLTEVGSDWLTN